MASAGQEVYVKLVSGQTVTLNVMFSDTVRSLAAQVAEQANLGHVQLKYQGKVLNAKHTVGYLGIRVETILKAEVVEVRTFTVTVTLREGDTVISTSRVRVQNVGSLKQILEQVEEDQGSKLPPGNNVLKMGTRILNNLDESLTEAGVPDGASLDLINKPPSKASAAGNNQEDDYNEAELAAVVNTFDAGGRPVDVVFSFDTTGSMSECLNRVRSRLRDACTRLLSDVPTLRIGIVAHGDYCDQSNYVLRQVDLTRDVNTLVDFVRDVSSTGGGDAAECYEWVLRKAQQMDWAEDSAKALVMIGDSEPHEMKHTDQNINWHEELDVLRGMGVKVYGIQALHRTEVSAFYQHIAEHTGGAYIKFNNFQVITDMFLAVCYREADAGGDGEGGQLEAFMEQLEEEGRLEGDVNEVIQQVAQEAPAQPQEQRYIALPWWDPTLCVQSSPSYKYDAENDVWSRNPAGSSPSAAISRSCFSASKKRKTKKGCSVM